MTDKILRLVWDVTSAKWTVKKNLVGSWHITEIKGFDSDYVNLCGPAKIKISTRGTGSINFGAVEAELDCKMDEMDERILRFSFEGEDEGDPFIGRGYCFIEDNEMIGRLFRHYGDEFGFKAKRLKK